MATRALHLVEDNYPRRPSDRCLEAAQSIINDRGVRWSTGIACGNFVNDLGNALTANRGAPTGAVCHAHLTYALIGQTYDRVKGTYVPADEAEIADPFVYVAVAKRSKRIKSLSPEHCDRYVKYLLTESPAREFVLNRDNEEDCRDGGVIIDMWNLGRAGTLWLAKALRAQYEEYYRIDHWIELTNRGVHPMLALNVAYCMTGNLLDQATATHGTCMYPPTMKKHLQEIFNEEPFHPLNGDWDNGSSTMTVVRRTTKKTDNAYGLWPDKHMFPISRQGKQVKEPDGWGGYTTKIVGQTYDQLATDLLAIQKEYVK